MAIHFDSLGFVSPATSPGDQTTRGTCADRTSGLTSTLQLIMMVFRRREFPGPFDAESLRKHFVYGKPNSDLLSWYTLHGIFYIRPALAPERLVPEGSPMYTELPEWRRHPRT